MPPAASTHAIGHNRQQAAAVARVVQKADLILLVVAITFVDPGGSLNAVAFGHSQS